MPNGCHTHSVLVPLMLYNGRCMLNACMPGCACLNKITFVSKPSGCPMSVDPLKLGLSLAGCAARGHGCSTSVPGNRNHLRSVCPPAGQSEVGESFVIGKGDAHASFGEWRAVCNLMQAALPPLRSNLLEHIADGASVAPPAIPIVSAAAAVRPGVGAPPPPGAGLHGPQTALQRLLLDGIATGCAQEGAEIYRLLR